MDWDYLIDEAGIAALLPEEQAHFARPVKEGLTVFLAGLPEERQREIFEHQVALGQSATMPERLGQIARNCPVLHKLGQTLARDQRLAAELRRQLCQLESLPPTVSLASIRQELLRELGPLNRRGIRLAPPAIAEASVAVVVPFDQVGGDQTVQGVFKILKPGIEERLELELDLLGRVGAHLDDRCHELNIPHLDYRDSFEQVKNKLASEVRLEQEQRHLAMAREFYADEPDVLIPMVLDHCTSRVTAMQRIWGVKITDHQLRSSPAKRRLSKLVLKALVSRPFFSDAAALFHCDPHAGNLVLTTDGRLAILDWSLVGRLAESQRIALMGIMLAALSLNAPKTISLVQQLADRGSVDLVVLPRVVGEWLQRCRRGQFPGLMWLVGLLDDAVLKARMRVPANLMLFRKSLLTLTGVTHELAGGDSQIDEVVATDFLRYFAGEWPLRWFRSPGSRQYATRVSNADLVELSLSWPLAAARFWFNDSPRICGDAGLIGSDSAVQGYQDRTNCFAAVAGPADRRHERIG